MVSRVVHQDLASFETEQYEADTFFWDDWIELMSTANTPLIQRLVVVLAVILVLTLFALVVWFTRRRHRDRETDE